jgi:hypothetical protein
MTGAKIAAMTGGTGGVDPGCSGDSPRAGWCFPDYHCAIAQGSQVGLLSLTASLNPTLVAATTVMLLVAKPARLMLGYPWVRT